MNNEEDGYARLRHDIDNRDGRTTWLWIKQGVVDLGYIEIDPLEVASNALENNQQNMNFVSVLLARFALFILRRVM